MLQDSLSIDKYSAAVGLFLEEYWSIDSIRSIAYIDASGISSPKFTPFYYEK